MTLAGKPAAARLGWSYRSQRLYINSRRRIFRRCRRMTATLALKLLDDASLDIGDCFFFFGLLLFSHSHASLHESLQRLLSDCRCVDIGR